MYLHIIAALKSMSTYCNICIISGLVLMLFLLDIGHISSCLVVLYRILNIREFGFCCVPLKSVFCLTNG